MPEYLTFAGVDVAFGGVESVTKLGGGNKGPKSSDDFAIFAWKWAEGQRAEPLEAWRWCGISPAQASAMIHRLHQKHHFVTILCDVGGGGPDLYRNIKLPKQTDLDGTRFNVTPLITENEEQMAGVGEPVWAFFKRGEPKIFGNGDTPGVCPSYQSDAFLVNQLHRVFKEAIQKKHILFPPKWLGWKELMGMGEEDANFMRTWLNEHEGLDDAERSRAEIDLAIQQLIQVERENDRDGKPMLDKFGQFSFTSRYKKDSAYAMLYGYFALWVFMERSRQEQEASSGEGESIVSWSEVVQ